MPGMFGRVMRDDRAMAATPSGARPDAGRRGRVGAVILAGGGGQRLGGVSKADLRLGQRRLLDIVLSGLGPAVDGDAVVVAPRDVEVPPGVRRTLEDPPDGGPVAGLAAGLAALAGSHALVLVTAVDSPGLVDLAPLLVAALSARPDADGVVARGGEPAPFRQYLQAVYRAGPLRRLLADAGQVRNRGVARTLRVLNLVEMPSPADLCRDIDTPDDLDWWRGRLV